MSEPRSSLRQEGEQSFLIRDPDEDPLKDLAVAEFFVGHGRTVEEALREVATRYRMTDAVLDVYTVAGVTSFRVGTHVTVEKA